MSQARFWTIQDYQDWKAERINRLIGIFIIGPALVAVGFAVIGLIGVHAEHKSAKAAGSESVCPTIIPSSSGDSYVVVRTNQYSDGLPPREEKITSGPLYSALLYAVREWSDSIRRPVRLPGLVSIKNGCPVGGLACADTGLYRIIVARIDGQDKRAVMLHEVAHLLGVPHIEGDPLMDGTYTGVVEHPTPFAVALAKVAKVAK